jgi:hypothetical protein
MNRLSPDELWVLFQVHGKPAGELSPLAFPAAHLKAPGRQARKAAEESLLDQDLLVGSGRTAKIDPDFAALLRVLYDPEAVVDAETLSANDPGGRGRTLFFLAGEKGVEAYASQDGFEVSEALERTQIFHALAKAAAPANWAGHELLATNDTYKMVVLVAGLLNNPYTPKDADSLMAELLKGVDLSEDGAVGLLAALTAGGVLENTQGAYGPTPQWQPVFTAVEGRRQVSIGIRHARRAEGMDALLFQGPPGHRMMVRALAGIDSSEGEHHLSLSWPGQAGLVEILHDLTRLDRFLEIPPAENRS